MDDLLPVAGANLAAKMSRALVADASEEKLSKAEYAERGCCAPLLEVHARLTVCSG